jgi:hypothetical protein
VLLPRRWIALPLVIQFWYGDLMVAPVFVEVDPRSLHLPPSSRCGADPGKLQRQIVRFG